MWATLSYGHGLLVWPVLLAMGLAARVPARFLRMVGIAFVCVLIFYFFDYRTPGMSANPLDSILHRPGAIIHVA